MAGPEQVPRAIGDLLVPALGFGAMTLTQVEDYDEQRSIRTLHAALDRGIRLVDTADVYGPRGGYGVNELLVARALKLWSGPRHEVVVATKGGHQRNLDGTWWIDGSPEHLQQACRASLARLETESIALYQHHRPDPRIPYAVSIEALAELRREGLIERVGISNVSADQILQAREILGVGLVSVQNQYSPLEPEAEAEIELCRQLGIAFLAYSPFGGRNEAKSLAQRLPRFARAAAKRGISTHRLVIAWQLARFPHVIPIPGASRPESVEDCFGALAVDLTSQEVAGLADDRGSGSKGLSSHP